MKKIAGIAASLYVGLASFSAHALFVPIGPQNDVLVTTVTNMWGWSECYSSLYSTPLGNDASAALANCAGDQLMLAARRVGGNEFEVLAAASRSDVLTDTGVNDDVTHAANGSEWYYSSEWSWGFAGAGDLVSKQSCDINEPGERDRLCWHTFDFVGGYRAGSFDDLSFSDEWERVILVADAAASVPEPVTASLFAMGLIGLCFTRRRSSNSKVANSESIVQ